MQWPQHHQAGLSSPADNEEEQAKDTMKDNEQAVNGGLRWIREAITKAHWVQK